MNKLIINIIKYYNTFSVSYSAKLIFTVTFLLPSDRGDIIMHQTTGFAEGERG